MNHFHRYNHVVGVDNLRFTPAQFEGHNVISDSAIVSGIQALKLYSHNTSNSDICDWGRAVAAGVHIC